MSDQNQPDMTTNQQTAIRIREERLKQNITQQAVAEHLGIDISTYSRLENGTVEITITRLQAIAEFFKVPIVIFIPNSNMANITINNGSYGSNSTLIHNYTDSEIQASLKIVIGLLQSQVTKELLFFVNPSKHTCKPTLTIIGGW